MDNKKAAEETTDELAKLILITLFSLCMTFFVKSTLNYGIYVIGKLVDHNLNPISYWETLGFILFVMLLKLKIN